MTRNTPGPDEDINDLGAALRGEVPSAGPGFWARLDAGFESLAADRDAEATPVDIASTTDTASIGERLNERRRSAVWPLALAAAVIIIAGLFIGNRLLVSGDRTIETGFSGEENSAGVEQLSGPIMNYDHWHAVYGVWDCTAANGAGDWVPAFESTRDESGIHSHQDGLIHIHPFFEWSAGENARLGLWADEMGITITDDAITLDAGRVLAEGQPCGPQGEPAVLHLRRWALDMEATRDPAPAPTVITTDLVDERFYNDREVWTIAYAPLDAEIPPPPTERFDALTNSVAAFDPDDLPAEIAPGIRLEDNPPPTPQVSFDLDSTITQQLQQLPFAVGSTDQAIVPVPEADAYGQVVPLRNDVDARVELEALATASNQELVPNPPGGTIAEEVRHLGAASSEGLSHEFYVYRATTEDSGDATLHCWAAVDSALTSALYSVPMLGCRSDSTLVWGGSGGGDGTQRSGFALLTDIDPPGVWFRVELDDGRILVANTADRASFVAWTGAAEVLRASVLDADLSEIWSG